MPSLKSRNQEGLNGRVGRTPGQCLSMKVPTRSTETLALAKDVDEPPEAGIQLRDPVVHPVEYCFAARHHVPSQADRVVRLQAYRVNSLWINEI
jgi:hypothetical protein